jgi:hypothetical protein
MKVTVNVPGGSVELAPSYLEMVGDAITRLDQSGNPPTAGVRFGAEFPTTDDRLVAGWWKVEQ